MPNAIINHLKYIETPFWRINPNKTSYYYIRNTKNQLFDYQIELQLCFIFSPLVLKLVVIFLSIKEQCHELFN